MKKRYLYYGKIPAKLLREDKSNENKDYLNFNYAHLSIRG